MPLRSERDHAGLVRVVPYPLLLLETGTAASFDQAAAVSGGCRPTLAASSSELRWSAELSHERTIRDSPHRAGAKGSIVTGAVRTAPVTHTCAKNKYEGRVGGLSCGPVVVRRQKRKGNKRVRSSTFAVMKVRNSVVHRSEKREGHVKADRKKKERNQRQLARLTTQSGQEVNVPL